MVNVAFDSTTPINKWAIETPWDHSTSQLAPEVVLRVPGEEALSEEHTGLRFPVSTAVAGSCDVSFNY